MARFDKIDVLAKMRITGIVPVFYHSNPEIAKQVVKACYDGGVRAFEFTTAVTSPTRYLPKLSSMPPRSVPSSP